MLPAFVTCQSSFPFRSDSWNGAGQLPGLKLSNGAATTTPAEACCRVCSPSIKKNSLSFRMAPPTLPPYWLRWKVAPDGNAAACVLSRKRPKPSPCRLLVPDFVATFTAPDEVRSFERSKLD